MPSPAQPSTTHPPRASVLKTWLPILLFSVLWVDLVRQLSYTWETNEQYAYGWFVPFLALGLFIRRWPSRPGAEGSGQSPDGRGQLSSAREVGGLLHGAAFQRFSVSAFVLLLCLLLLPLRVILEINPDWPFIAWPYTILVVALTLYAVHLADPSSVLRPLSSALRPDRSVSGFQRFSFLNFRFATPWVAHFAFPVCFILVAVQWPYRIEHSLTQNLMQVVANLTVEILGWFNIPAFQRGNLIEVSTGVLGVDEACSGIRSFQSTLMAALFLGELYRLRWPIRLLLVGAGLAAAFLLNVCRTLLLTWQANAHGLSAIDKWHDPAGFTIAIACFAVLWLIAVLVKKRWSAPDSQLSTFNSQPPEGLQPSASSPPSSDPRPQTSDIRPKTLDCGHKPPPSDVRLQTSGSALRTPRSAFRIYLLAVGLWSLLCILTTEAWYRSHEAKNTSFVRWSVQLPETKPTFQTLKLPPRTLKLLAYDSGTAAKWQEEDGSEWDVYFFQWQGKSIQSILAARYHRPEVCLPASGLKQISDSQTDYFGVVGLKLPFRKSSYSAPGQTLYVFYCIWQDGDERREGMRARGPADRLLGPMEGRRRFGQQVLEIITSGYANAAEAERAVRQRLPNLIRVERPAGPAKSPGGH